METENLLTRVPSDLHSVVFASSFRISVFLHDISSDMTYTLAPDAGWTLIEMTAAVVSVSFPALGPALIEIYKKLLSCAGLKKSRTAKPRSDQRHAAAIKGHQEPIESTTAINLAEEDGGTLYSLSDFVKGHEETHESWGQAGEVGRRPVTTETARDQEDSKALSLTVTRSQDRASDEVPLNGIRARRSVSQSSTQGP